MKLAFPRFGSLHARFAVAAVGIIALLGLLSNRAITNAADTSMKESAETATQSIASQCAQGCARFLDRNDTAGLQNYLDASPLSHEIRSLTVMDSRGAVLCVRRRDATSAEAVSARATISSNGIGLGTVLVEREMMARERHRDAAIRAAAVVLPCAILVAMAALVLMVDLIICRHLRSLRTATAAVAGGVFPERVGWAGSNEIARLGRDFDHMVANLRAAHETQGRLMAELKDRTERALAAERAKGDFLANMSHEVRTPLNGVVGMTNLLLFTKLDAEQREYAEAIQTSSEALLHIVSDVLDISKLKDGRVELERIAFSPRKVLQEAELILRHQAQSKALRIDWTSERTVPAWVMGDPARLRQVLLNIAGNAIKFTEHGRVSVAMSGRSVDGCVETEVCVTDSGIGIAPTKLQELFKPFTQADTSSTRRYGGAGLGLVISKHLVEAMGGQIWVASTPGVGSRFTFTCRFAPAVDATPAVDEPLPQSQCRVRVLVAGDDTSSRRQVAVLLDKIGLEIAEAADAAEALEALKTSAFDAILMDCEMPGADGCGTTHGIRALEQQSG